MSEPLAGKTVLLTRLGGLADEIRELGADVRVAPVTKYEPVKAAADPKDFDWVVLTSARAVEYLPFELKDARRIACSGPDTARAVEKGGGRVGLVPQVHTAAALAAALVEFGVGEGTRVLFPCADRALPTIKARLGTAGASVTRLEVYRTVPVAEIEPGITDGVDVIVFLAPSAVNAFERLGGDLAAAPTLAIGPTTADALEDHGVTAEVAPSADRKGLIEALKTRRWK